MTRKLARGAKEALTPLRGGGAGAGRGVGAAGGDQVLIRWAAVSASDPLGICPLCALFGCSPAAYSVPQTAARSDRFTRLSTEARRSVVHAPLTSGAITCALAIYFATEALEAGTRFGR